MRLIARFGLGLGPVFALHLHLHLHHHFRGSPIDYTALAAAAAASWAGLPGPGEPVLIAASVIAARHRLDIASVLVVAWLGASGGGVAGWIMGLKGGRTVLSAPGPLQGMRLKAVARGDEVFSRHPVLGVSLAPSWIAGIHGVSARIFLPINALSAVIWSCGIGLGAYYVGPAVVDVVDDAGWLMVTALAVLVLAGVGGGILRQRHRRQAKRTSEEEQAQASSPEARLS